MAETEQLESVFGITTIESREDAVDQLEASTYILRGVSDSLLALSEAFDDYQEAIRMLADVTFHQSENTKRIREVIEKSFAVYREQGGKNDVSS